MSAESATKATQVTIETGQQVGLWQKMKDAFQGCEWSAFRERFGNIAGIGTLVLWLSAGFASGYLLRRYFDMALMVIVMTVLLVKGLEYHNLITINWDGLRAMVGIAPQSDMSGAVANVCTMLKDQAILWGAGAVGFVIGYRFAV